MRNTGMVATMAAALCLSGCGAITRDLRHPGGYPGHLLDERTFDASESKKVQLLRFTIILAMAARMGGETVTDAKEADAIADYLAAAADEINYAAANIYPSDGGVACRVGDVEQPARPLPGQIARLDAAVADAERAAQDAGRSAQVATAAETSVRAMLASGNPPAIATAAAPEPAVPPCNGYFVNFEADVPLIEARMMRLLFATLPRDHVRKFAEDIQKGNFLGSAWNGLKVVFVGIKGLHTASGTYRSGQEAVVANLDRCSSKSAVAPDYDEYDETRWTVKQAVACLGISADNLFGPHPGEIAGEDMRIDVSGKTFMALMQLARTSCVRLPIGTADNSNSELAAARSRRAALCDRLRWNPKPKLDSLGLR
ncbi:hypothetical protein [Sphingopyxis macrogoltabida]|nr:hypothetical protein [Sphingopyxis macrogoltabida]